MMFGLTSKIPAAVAAAAFATVLAGGVQAATVTPVAFSTNAIGNMADVFAPGYGANTPNFATWSADPTVTPPPGSIGSVYSSPFANTAISETQDYFSVGAVNGGNGALSPVTLTYAEAQDSFDLLWGSIDTYNTIDFYLGAANVYSLSGTALAAILGVNLVTSTGFATVALLNFGDFGPGGFDSVMFTAGNAAFEFALPTPAPIPVPAGGLLLVSALGGFALLRRRKAA